MSENTKRKMGDSRRGEKNVNFGKKFSKETCLKISLAHKGKPNFSARGEKSRFWKGGITPINRAIRNSIEYINWRRGVFERDNYTCVLCGIRGHKGLGKRVVLNADHIKPFATYPELRFELSNGRTLCVDCHRKTDTYGKNWCYVLLKKPPLFVTRQDTIL